MPASHSYASTTHRQRLAVAVLVLLILLAGGGLVAARQWSGTPARAGAADADRGREGDGATTGADDIVPVDTDADADSGALDEDALDATDDSTGFDDSAGEFPEPDAGEASGGPLDPAGSEGEGAAQCQDVLAAGDALLVTPDPAVLPSGVMSSALLVTNCSDAAVDWTAQTIPNVTLAHAAGNLSPGSSSELGFTIDGSAYEPGAVTFKIKVSEPGRNHYIDVQAFRELVGSDLVGNFGLTAGPQAGGCANQCITSALLSTVFNSPNVNLEVRTNTPAALAVWVSTSAPLVINNVPMFPGVGAMATSGGMITSWTIGLSPLSPATHYHIIVRATDANGSRSYRSGEFTTTTPVEQPGDLLDLGNGPGCFVQCITTALVSPEGDATALHVETHTSAILDVYVSETAPQEGPGGIPTFGGVAPIATTDGLDVESWDVILPGLRPDTAYHIIVRASDLFGGRSYRAGTFHTAPGPQYIVRFEQIHVQGDGDDGGWNRGELSFRWGFGDYTMGGRSEEKISSNTTIHLGSENTGFIVEDDGGDLPELYLSGAERDPDGLSEFCTAGTGVAHEPHYIASCDVKINVAASGSVSFDSLDSRARCSIYGIDELADEACLMFESVTGLGGDYATFWVVASVERID